MKPRQRSTRRSGRARHGDALPRRRIEATITELASSGEGVSVCTVDGERRAIFVRGAASGETIEIDVDLSTRPARGRLLRVIDPSRGRIAPPCAHVEPCGGCDWMFLSAETRAREHAAIVARALPRAFAGVPVVIDALRDPLPGEVKPRELGYRTRARLHVKATKQRAGSSVVVGMYGRGTHDPVSVETCVILDPVLDDARASLGALLEGSEGRGEAHLSLGLPAEGDRLRKAVLDLRWRGELPPEVFARLERAVDAGLLAGARVFEGAVSLPATIGDPIPWIMGADGVPLQLGSGGFSQATELGNARLGRRIVELTEEIASPSDDVLELYAGAGNLTVLFARNRRVVAIESDRSACVAARSNLAARGLAARVVEADVDDFTVPPTTRLVVLDPPRTGAREIIRKLAVARPPGVVYVSCDPPTLGRDLAILADAGYEVRRIEVFEMFPQTSHVETVVTLTCSRARPARPSSAP